ncbi:MAG: synthase protein [Bacteroidetes bacterium]|nr:synthase protein [Bacteroidota bacterium]
MNKFILKLIISLLLFYPVVGIAVGLVLYEYFPMHYFSLYPVIPGYFSILGTILFCALLYYRKNNPQKTTKVYMIFRGFKFLLTIGATLLFIITYEDFEYEFSITTAGFYFFYIITETYLFTRFERERVAKCKKD